MWKDRLGPDDDSIIQMFEAIKTNMASTSLQHSMFEKNIISSLDTKLSEVKTVYDSSVGKLQVDVQKHEGVLEMIQAGVENLDVKTTDIEVRIDKFEDEIGACRRLNDDLTCTLMNT